MLKMVSERKLTRVLHRRPKTIQAKIFELWKKYDNKELSVNMLLNEIKDIYASP